MSRRELILAALTLVGAIAGAALSTFGGLALGPAAVLGGAAVVAIGTELAAVLAGLALLAGLAAPVTALAPLPWWTLAAGALALGGAACVAAPRLAALVGPGGRQDAGAAVLAVGLALAMLLPDAVVRLAGDGAPALFHAVIRDATTGARFSTWQGVLVAHDGAGAGLTGALLVAALVAGFALLAARASGHERTRRAAWTLAFVVGAAGALLGLVGLAELAVGSVAPPDADALRQHWSLYGGPLLAVERVDVPAGLSLAAWSRPMVDGVRLLLGALLAAVAFRAVRQPIVTASGPKPTPAAAPELPLALALSVAAALLAPTAGLALLLGAGALMLLAALVVGRWSAPDAPSPTYAVLFAVVLGVAAWTAAAANWFPA
ncbi:MAG: hypothetical protein H6745_18775 [Deltaproteobacteria bacterium]|nr:hypothetical protein [Deltaproteobacteria bacterium]